MTKSVLENSPRWPAFAPITAGVLGLVAFAMLSSVWAAQNTIDAKFVAQGHLATLEVSSDAPQSNNLMRISLSPAGLAANSVPEGRMATVSLWAVDRNEIIEFSGKIQPVSLDSGTKNGLNSGSILAEINLPDSVLGNLEGVKLFPETPVSMSVEMPPRSPLSYLLAPLNQYGNTWQTP